MRIESNFVGGSLGTFRPKNHVSIIAALRSFSTFLFLKEKVERTDFRDKPRFKF